MAKRELFVCDGEDCGAILVTREDGFVVTGTIQTGIVEAEPKLLISATPDAPKAYCISCFMHLLQLPYPVPGTVTGKP